MPLKHCKSAMLIAQLWPTVCDPMDCSPPGFSVHGVLQARVLEWMPYPFPGDLPNPGIKLGSPTLQADSLLSEPPGKTPNQLYLYLKKKCDQFSPIIALTSLFSTEVNLQSQPFHRQLPLIILYSTVGPDWRVVK